MIEKNKKLKSRQNSNQDKKQKGKKTHSTIETVCCLVCTGWDASGIAMRKSFSLPLLYLRERGKGREMPCNHTCISPAAQTDSRKKAAHSTNVQWRARRGKGTEENRGGRGMARGRSKKRAASPVLESVWTVVVVVGCCWLLLAPSAAVAGCISAFITTAQDMALSWEGKMGVGLSKAL